MGGYRSNQSKRSQGVAPDLRSVILARDSHRCQINGPRCTGRATEVDHIIPVFEDGTDDPANLRGVCPECHAIKTQEEAQRARAKFSRRRPAARSPFDTLHDSFEAPGVGEPLPGPGGLRTA